MNYTPRSVFQPYHDRKQRFSLQVAHRRCGKTVAELNDLQRTALTCPLNRPQVAYIAPTFTQAKKVAWDYAMENAANIPGVKFNKSELIVHYPNNAKLFLLGADNPDSHRGMYFDHVALDEYGDMFPRMWTEVVRPAISDRIGRADFIGTPKGMNHFYDLYIEALSNPQEWYVKILKASDTGLIDPEELEALKRNMPKEEFLQEYECSFEGAIKGAYFADYLAECRANEQFIPLTFEKDKLVHTSWDLGYSDMTAIWLFFTEGRNVFFPRYLEFEQTGLDRIISELNAIRDVHGFQWGTHYVPHDVKKTTVQLAESVMGTMERLGLKDLSPGRHKPDQWKDRINAVRSILPRCYFDPDGTRDGVAALGHYRSSWDSKRRVYSEKPLHDWSSDGAEAFSEFAMQWRFKNKSRPQKSIYGQRASAWSV